MTTAIEDLRADFVNLREFALNFMSKEDFDKLCRRYEPTTPEEWVDAASRVITADNLRSLFETSQESVEKCIILIYRRQTNDEKNSKTTRWNNGVGFSAAHGKVGAYMAQWIIKQDKLGKPWGQRLSGRFIDKGRELITHYARQLAES